jgi:hypothetical protein
MLLPPATSLLLALLLPTGAASGGCRWDGVAHDFFSHNGSGSLMTTASGSNEREMDASCCRQCRARAGCTFWVRSTTNNHCWLKSDFSHFGGNTQRRGSFLGPPPPLPPPPGPTPPPNPMQVTVFQAGMGGFACFRTPSTIQTANKTLLAFAEARVESCSDHNAAAVVMRRSTSHGKTGSRGTPSAWWMGIHRRGGAPRARCHWPRARSTSHTRSGRSTRHDLAGGCESQPTMASTGQQRQTSRRSFRSTPALAPSPPDSGLQLQSDPARLILPFHNAVVLSTDSGASLFAPPLARFVPSEVSESAIADLDGGELLLNGGR